MKNTSKQQSPDNELTLTNRSYEIELQTLSQHNGDQDSTSSQETLEQQSQFDDSLKEQKQFPQKSFDLGRAKGLLWMLLSATMTAMMNNIIKYTRTTTQVSVLQAIVMRAFYLGIGSYAHLKWDKQSVLNIPQAQFKNIMLRCLTGFAATITFYEAIDLLPLSLAVTLYYTSPIVTAIVCYVLLGEKLAKLEILSIFSSLFGVILLTKPELIATSLKTQTNEEKFTNDEDYFKYCFGLCLSLGGSITGAFAYYYCRRIGKSLHPAMHPFYLSMYQSIFGFILLLLSNQFIGLLNLFEFTLLTIVGICSWIQQLSQSIALQTEKGGRSAAINYLVVVNSFLADAFFFGDPIYKSEIIGAICIVFFTFLNAFLKCFGKTN